MDSIDGFQFNNCVGQFMDTFGTKDHLNERYRLKDRYLIRSNEYWNMIDQDGSGLLEENEFRDIVIVFAWLDANVLFKCNQYYEKHRDFYEDLFSIDSLRDEDHWYWRAIVNLRFRELDMREYDYYATGNEPADLAQLARLVIYDWWSYSGTWYACREYC